MHNPAPSPHAAHQLRFYKMQACAHLPRPSTMHTPAQALHYALLPHLGIPNAHLPRPATMHTPAPPPTLHTCGLRVRSSLNQHCASVTLLLMRSTLWLLSSFTPARQEQAEGEAGVEGEAGPSGACIACFDARPACPASPACLSAFTPGLCTTTNHAAAEGQHQQGMKRPRQGLPAAASAGVHRTVQAGSSSWASAAATASRLHGRRTHHTFLAAAAWRGSGGAQQKTQRCCKRG